jgi:hypothetical protein
VGAAESSDDENKIEAKPQPKKRRRKGDPKKPSKRDSKVLASMDDPSWLTEDDVSDGEGFGKNRGGRPTNPVLLLVSRICRRVVRPKNGFFEKPVDEKGLKPTKVTTGSGKAKKEKDPDVRVRCVGSVGCKTTWATPRSQIRVFGHVKSCKWVPKTLRKQVMTLMAKDSLGDIAEALDTSESEGDRLLDEEEESINGRGDELRQTQLLQSQVPSGRNRLVAPLLSHPGSSRFTSWLHKVESRRSKLVQTLHYCYFSAAIVCPHVLLIPSNSRNTRSIRQHA